MDTSDSAGQSGQDTGLEEMDSFIRGARAAGGSTSSYASASSSANTNSVSSISKQIRKIKNAAAAPRMLGQHNTCRTVSYGYLTNTESNNNEDHHYKLAHFRELYDKKLNISTSFDPSSLMCVNCHDSPHHILETACRSKPAAFVLTDQCFPAALPAAAEKDCLSIIRVEDATIDDLVATFMRMFRGCYIAIGSIIVMNSLNHLGRVGTAAYAEDLVDALNTIRHTFGGQVRVVHGYPICTANIIDPVTIRALV